MTRRRVLLIGPARRGSWESSMRDALRRQGHTVALLDDRRLKRLASRRGVDAWLRVRAASFRPDVVVWGKVLGASPDALAKVCAGRRAVMWYWDLRVPPDPRIVERARVADTLYLTAGGQAGQYEALGVRQALFLPSVADPALDQPVAPAPAFDADIAFIGNGYDAARAELLCRLAERWRVKTFGAGWEAFGQRVGWMGRSAHGRDYARVCSSARIVLGLAPSFQIAAQIARYASDRLCRTLACGGFLLTPATPGLGELFRDDQHLAYYESEPHLHQQIERYLHDPAARAMIAAAGRDLVLSHYTFAHAIPHLFTPHPWSP